jgi:hypothetical protein
MLQRIILKFCAMNKAKIETNNNVVYGKGAMAAQLLLK